MKRYYVYGLIFILLIVFMCSCGTSTRLTTSCAGEVIDRDDQSDLVVFNSYNKKGTKLRERTYFYNSFFMGNHQDDSKKYVKIVYIDEEEYLRLKEQEIEEIE